MHHHSPPPPRPPTLHFSMRCSGALPRCNRVSRSFPSGILTIHHAHAPTVDPPPDPQGGALFHRDKGSEQNLAINSKTHNRPGLAAYLRLHRETLVDRVPWVVHAVQEGVDIEAHSLEAFGVHRDFPVEADALPVPDSHDAVDLDEFTDAIGEWLAHGRMIPLTRSARTLPTGGFGV